MNLDDPDDPNILFHMEEGTSKYKIDNLLLYFKIVHCLFI